jgi:hypothetical protein
MSRFYPGACLAIRYVNFLDATEEEIFDLVSSMAGELVIMSCFLTLPPEQKKAVQASIASFQAYLGNQQSKH